MPEITFTNEKADRWIARLEKRADRLSPEDLEALRHLKALRQTGTKIPPNWERILFHLSKKV